MTRAEIRFMKNRMIYGRYIYFSNVSDNGITISSDSSISENLNVSISQ